MKLVKVILKKDGKEINVLPSEVEGLIRAGKIAGKIKESKIPSETKEEKHTGETKKNELEAKEKMYPSARRPANISTANIRGGNPKKIK
jgi:hypothetical protein